jgi:SWIM zinc finger
MDAREQRGLVIAATSRVKRKGNQLWTVPSQSSQSGKVGYLVNPDKKTCTCLDHQEGGHFCKHLYAVKFVIQREFEFDAETGITTETETVLMQTVKKTTYKQNWPTYNRCKTVEKETFQELLHDLCSAIKDESPRRRGRPRIPVADAIFSVVYKIYSGMSGRRFMTDMREALSHRNGANLLSSPWPTRNLNIGVVFPKRLWHHSLPMPSPASRGCNASRSRKATSKMASDLN